MHLGCWQIISEVSNRFFYFLLIRRQCLFYFYNIVFLHSCLSVCCYIIDLNRYMKIIIFFISANYNICTYSYFTITTTWPTAMNNPCCCIQLALHWMWTRNLPTKICVHFGSRTLKAFSISPIGIEIRY